MAARFISFVESVACPKKLEFRVLTRFSWSPVLALFGYLYDACCSSGPKSGKRSGKRQLPGDPYLSHSSNSIL